MTMSSVIQRTLLLVLWIFSLLPVNWDISLVPICEIQGTGFTSPWRGATVRVQGVVFADQDQSSHKGFYLQQSDCDMNSQTSDGIWVYLGQAIEVVSIGDEIEVTGVVEEYFGMTEITASPIDVIVKATNQVLPLPLELNPPLDPDLAQAYFEAHEGMHVRMSEGRVVGPTQANNRSWVVASSLNISRVFEDDLAGTGEIVCVDDGGLFRLSPEVKVGDLVQGLRGALDFRQACYCLQLFSEPQVLPVTDEQYVETDSPSTLTIGTFNLAELFDPIDDPITDDEVISASEYQRRLQKRALAIQQVLNEPDVLALQEVETFQVLQDLIAQPVISTQYGVLMEDGPDPRGLDIGLIYRLERARLEYAAIHQGCTSLIDGLGPDGNGDPQHPENVLTCDINGDGTLDGNRLFSRPPLAARLKILADPAAGDMWVIVNHWKSRLEDTRAIAYTAPRRREQALFVRDLTASIRRDYPGARLVVLGDLNDHLASEPLQTLVEANLRPLLGVIPKAQRYTYIFEGISQELDHILIDLPASLQPTSIQVDHINADYPYGYATISESVIRSSDHDPLRINLQKMRSVVYLPWVRR